MVNRELLEQAGVSAQKARQLERAWGALQASAMQKTSDTPCILCTGIYNAGKSTLLNTLVGEDCFPTGDIPTTKAVAQAEFGGALYIDTPGLNAEEEDDRETQAAYEAADFVLFVSNAQNGGVSAAEAGWLQGLQRRYTEEGLKRRLIYVLTHSAQVDAEELPGIQEQFRHDLEQTLGFAPEQVFCVDSITFQDGKTQNIPVLMESSGIPQLKAYLDEQIANAGDTLRQAREVELEMRRQEMAQALAEVRAVVQKACDAECEQIRAKSAAVDEVWAELEKELAEALPGEKVYLGYSGFNLRRPSVHGEARSESEARQKIQQGIASAYHDRDRVMRQTIAPLCEAIRKNYASAGMNSAYSHCCDQLNQVFLRAVLRYQKLGLLIDSIPELSVSIDLPSNLAFETEQMLNDGVVRTDGPYSLEKYARYGDVSYAGSTYEKGLFGRERAIPCYTYSAYGAVDEMEKDMQDALKMNIGWVEDKLNGFWENFLKKLQPEVDKRKSALKMQVDGYKKNLSAGKEPSHAQEALHHLDALKREAVR